MPENFDEQYQGIIDLILTKGKSKGGPQATGTKAYFGHQIRIDASGNNPPLLTIRKASPSIWKNARGELLWILSGSDSAKELGEKFGVHIWDLWARDEICDSIGLPRGTLGRIYGPQWRRYRGYTGDEIDQVSLVVEGLKKNPDNRRHEIIAWDPTLHNIKRQSPFIAPCIRSLHFNHAEGELTLCAVQGSADVALGVPTDVPEYWLLLKMMAQVTGLKARELVYTLEDMHIYNNHLEQMTELTRRNPFGPSIVEINPTRTDIFSFEMDDFRLSEYQHHPGMKLDPSE